MSLIGFLAFLNFKTSISSSVQNDFQSVTLSLFDLPLVPCVQQYLLNRFRNSLM